MSNVEPFEIIAQPFTLWVAAVGTPFPDVDEDPSGSWTKVGTSGNLNYSEDGVVVSHDQKVESFRSLGSTGRRKSWRTEEDQMIKLKLHDVTLEQYSIAMGYNTVTTTAAAEGTPGTKKIGLLRGRTVAQRALLIRGGQSPYGAAFAMQYEIPVAVEVGAKELNWNKKEPAGLELEYDTLEDPDATSEDERFGRLIAQTAEAGT